MEEIIPQTDSLIFNEVITALAHWAPQQLQETLKAKKAKATEQ